VALTRTLIERNDLVLMEASIAERVRRETEVGLHPRLHNAMLVADPTGRKELRRIYGDYVEVARGAALPLLLCTPTWRANRERLEEAGIDSDLNGEAVRFLTRLRDEAADRAAAPILVGGLIGCRNDCYRPEEGLPADEARAFHAWQLERLARAGADFLIAETLPHRDEALGIAQAMAATGSPFLVSFVIDRSGTLLDGTPLIDAVRSIDEAVEPRPLGYMTNCSYPTFLRAETQPPALFERLIGLQANGSSLDHSELDGAPELQADDVAAWGEAMLTLNRRYGVTILGGCCGTGADHLRYLAEARKKGP
jgi:S-methylmethionine-dependent homocysteine/selenocysteine methylase